MAVTVEKETETKGGLAVFGGAINLGTQGKSGHSDVTVNRIEFSVPVAFRQKEGFPMSM
jgi:hypothetical protein